MSLLQMSFSGAVMILAIIVIRALAINKLPKRVFLILWELALLRLLMPFSIPSILSIYTIIDRNTSAMDLLKETPTADMIPQTETAAVKIYEGVKPMVQNDIPDISIWFVVWVIGMVLCTGYFLIAWLRCCSEFQMSLPVKNGFADSWLIEHHLKRSITIRQSERISAPLTYGVLKPVILMPKNTDWENRQQLMFVLMHEYVHICRFDAVFKFIATLVLCMHWFNPFVWVLYVLYNRDIELACDEKVVRHFGNHSRSNYAMTLINWEETKSGLTPLRNNFSKNAIEERITAIMKTKKWTIGLLAISVAVIAAIVLLFATSAKEETTQSADGIVAEEIQVPEVVLDAAKQVVEQKFENQQEDIYSNWRIESLEYAYTYNDFDEMTLQVYQMNYDFRAKDPDEVILAGGMSMDEEGWVVPEYANSTFLIFMQEGEKLSYMTTLVETDCFPGENVFTEDLKEQIEEDLENDSKAEELSKNVRESTMTIKYMLEGVEEEMPATLYVGEGFSVYIPDGGWEICDDLEEPEMMTAIRSSENCMRISHYKFEKIDSVEERLISEGYTYDSNSGKLRKESGDFLTEARLYYYENGIGVWAIFCMYRDTPEWEARLDAIADTFAVTEGVGENSSKWEQEIVEKSEDAKELENIMTAFCTAYFEGEANADTINQYLSEAFEGDLESQNVIYSMDELTIKGIKGLDTEMEAKIGDTCTLSLEFAYPNEDSYTYLTVEFTKESDGWKILSYGLEK